MLYIINKLVENNLSLCYKVTTEIEILRTWSHLQFHFWDPLKKEQNCLLVYTLNTQNLALHIEDVVNDNDVMKTNLLCFQETHVTKITEDNLTARECNLVCQWFLYMALLLVLKKQYCLVTQKAMWQITWKQLRLDSRFVAITKTL